MKEQNLLMKLISDLAIPLLAGFLNVLVKETKMQSELLKELLVLPIKNADESLAVATDNGNRPKHDQRGD